AMHREGRMRDALAPLPRKDPMRRSLASLLCLAALLAAAGNADAQRTTAQVMGVVTDASGAILPGVTVTIKGPAIVGTQTSVTNDKGLYRFAALPPGDYSLTFSLSGFATLNREALRAGVGAVVEENVALKISQMAEEVTVTGETAVVNATTNQVSTNYDKDW